MGKIQTSSLSKQSRRAESRRRWGRSGCEPRRASSARPAAPGTGLMHGRCPETGTSPASPGFGLSKARAGPRAVPQPPVQGPGSPPRPPVYTVLPGEGLSIPPCRERLQSDRPEPRRDGEPGRGQLPRPGAQQPPPLRQELLLPEKWHLHPVWTALPPPPPQPPPRAGGSFLSHRAHPSIMHSPWDGCGVEGVLAPRGGDPVLPNVPPAISCSLCTSPDVAGC